MFDLKVNNGNEVLLIGRLDASSTEKLQNTLDAIESDCIVNFKDLEYISSAGLGTLIRTYTRLSKSGGSIKLTNLNKHVSEVFKYSGLNKVFLIE